MLQYGNVKSTFTEISYTKFLTFPKTPIEYDREAYKRRNLIERCVNRLKQFRRIATRYEKTARAYLSMLCIAAAKLWIKTVNTA